MPGGASGAYAVIDFVVVLFGYARSFERTLQDFYEDLHPYASVFMALFGREHLPARSTLSRFLAALTPEPVEALRILFLHDLLARPLMKEEQSGGLWDRQEKHFLVFDFDGTREASVRGSTCAIATFAFALCPRLHRTQARRGRPHAHHRLACAHAKVALPRIAQSR